MFKISLQKLFFVIGIGTIFVTIVQIYLIQFHDEAPIGKENVPILLWWTSFGSGEVNTKCGDTTTCFITQDRSYIENPQLQAVLFYGSDVELNDLPVPRTENIKWALLHEESPRNNLVFVYEEALRLFNYSATFSRYSDLPLTLVDLPGEAELFGTTYFIDTKMKNHLMKEDNLAPVLYIQSNCDTMNNRDSFVLELMKYIPVDSYGSCINNRQLPKHLKENYMDTLHNEDFYSFVAQYKFTLALENAVCDDYITEKLWRPLIVGSVPVYFGSPTFKDWLPNEAAAIAVSDFKHPKELAHYLKQLMNNDEQYEKHLKHKLSPIRQNNNFLSNALKLRPKDLSNPFGHYVHEFECLVCRKLHEKTIRTMTQREYNCSEPVDIFIGAETSAKSVWADMWKLEACTARLLYRWISQNNSSSSQFNADKLRTYDNRLCNE